MVLGEITVGENNHIQALVSGTFRAVLESQNLKLVNVKIEII